MTQEYVPRGVASRNKVVVLQSLACLNVWEKLREWLLHR